MEVIQEHELEYDKEQEEYKIKPYHSNKKHEVKPYCEEKILRELNSLSRFPRCIVFDLDDTLWSGDVDCTAGPPFYFGSSHNPLNSTEKDSVLVDLLFDTNPQKQKSGSSNLACRRSTIPALKLFKDVASILSWLYSMRNVIYVCAASRTTQPQWARQALKNFRIPLTVTDNQSISLIEIFTVLECYPGCKRRHFKKITTQLRLAVSDIVFYDNLYSNVSDIQHLSPNSRSSVTCIYTPNGLNWKLFLQGLKEHQNKFI